MKKMLLTAVALVAVAATPALAQTHRTRHHVRAPSVDAYEAFAASPNAGRRLSSQPYDVYDTSGHYVGSDPDPTVRAQLAHDSGVNDD
jgi:hypothetical protein